MKETFNIQFWTKRISKYFYYHSDFQTPAIAEGLIHFHHALMVFLVYCTNKFKLKNILKYILLNIKEISITFAIVFSSFFYKKNSLCMVPTTAKKVYKFGKQHLEFSSFKFIVRTKLPASQEKVLNTFEGKVGLLSKLIIMVMLLRFHLIGKPIFF